MRSAFSGLTRLDSTNFPTRNLRAASGEEATDGGKSTIGKPKPSVASDTHQTLASLCRRKIEFSSSSGRGGNLDIRRNQCRGHRLLEQLVLRPFDQLQPTRTLTRAKTLLQITTPSRASVPKSRTFPRHSNFCILPTPATRLVHNCSQGPTLIAVDPARHLLLSTCLIFLRNPAPIGAPWDSARRWGKPFRRSSRWRSSLGGGLEDRDGANASMRPQPEGCGEPGALKESGPSGAASMRPQPEGCGEPSEDLEVTSGLAMLQCGHSPKAVENDPASDASEGAGQSLQCGHSPKAVENRAVLDA